MYRVSFYTFRDFVSRLFLKASNGLFSLLVNGESFKSRNFIISQHFATFVTFVILVIFMVNFKKYLQESKDMKFDAIASKKDFEPNPYSCNYSPVSHHKYCEHEHCRLSDEFRDFDKQKITLQEKLREEEDYLKYGEGTVGYDRLSVFKNVLKLKNELKNLLGERRK